MKNTEYVGYKTGTPVDFKLLDKVCKYLNEDKDNFLNTSSDEEINTTREKLDDLFWSLIELAGYNIDSLDFLEFDCLIVFKDHTNYFFGIEFSYDVGMIQRFTNVGDAYYYDKDDSVLLIEFDSAELAKQQSNAKRSVKELYNWLDENFTEYTPITNSIYKQIINYIN